MYLYIIISIVTGSQWCMLGPIICYWWERRSHSSSYQQYCSSKTCTIIKCRRHELGGMLIKLISNCIIIILLYSHHPFVHLVILLLVMMNRPSWYWTVEHCNILSPYYDTFVQTFKRYDIHVLIMYYNNYCI